MTADRKPTNPKDAVGVRKFPLSVVPAPVLAELAVAMLEGARKYGRHNYRVAGVRASVYYDAAFRHLAAWWEGEDIDPDSALSHVTKAIATLTVLRDSMLRENWVDDRPPKCDPSWVPSANAAAAAVIDRYPDAEDAYTERETQEGLPIVEVEARHERPGWFTDDDEDWIVHAPDVVISRYRRANTHLWVNTNNPNEAGVKWSPLVGFCAPLQEDLDAVELDAACRKFWESLDTPPDTVHDRLSDM